MQGAVTLEWLLANPDWHEAIDIGVQAQDQAEAELNRRAAGH